MNAAAPVLSIRRLDSQAADFAAALDALNRFEAAQDPAVDATVATIIADVRTRGDAAVLEYTERFDGIRASRVADLAIGSDTMRAAYDALPSPERAALETAAARIRAFHERQKHSGFEMASDDGTRLGQRITPIDRVGLYVPGGKAAYPSSVLMNAIPAHVAGVGEIVMMVPTPVPGDASAAHAPRNPASATCRANRNADVSCLSPPGLPVATISPDEPS